MNYQAVYDYARDITQNLGLTVKFFHGRKEWLALTLSDKPIYAYMLPLTSNGSFLNNNPQETWQLNILFYQQDLSDSAIDQNNQDSMQDEMKILAITSQAADEFMRLFEFNDLSEELESASDLLTITSFTKENAIKDTAQILTGTFLTINFAVADSFDYCCFQEIIPLPAPSGFVLSNPMQDTLDAAIVSNSNSQEDNFEWSISTDGENFTVAGLTAKNVLFFQYTGLDPNTTYYGKARALLTDKDSSFSNVGTENTLRFDPDAQAWFDRMTNPTEAQQIAYNDWVTTTKAIGNFDLIDEYFGLMLGDNSLIGLKSKTAESFGGTVFNSNGAFLDGINSYIDSNFNTSTDGTNYSQNDAIIYCFVFNSLKDNSVVYGNGAGLPSRVTLSSGVVANIGVSLNGGFNVAPPGISDKTSYAMSRIVGGEFTISRNGVLTNVLDNDSIDVPNLNLFVGAINSNGSPVSFWQGTISSLLIGGGIGFDIAGQEIADNQLLTDLGILP